MCIKRRASSNCLDSIVFHSRVQAPRVTLTVFTAEKAGLLRNYTCVSMLYICPSIVCSRLQFGRENILPTSRIYPIIDKKMN